MPRWRRSGLSNDMFTLFLDRAAPAERGLIELTLPGGARIWRFPADYAQRFEQNAPAEKGVSR